MARNEERGGGELKTTDQERFKCQDDTMGSEIRVSDCEAETKG